MTAFAVPAGVCAQQRGGAEANDGAATSQEADGTAAGDPQQEGEPPQAAEDPQGAGPPQSEDAPLDRSQWPSSESLPALLRDDDGDLVPDRVGETVTVAGRASVALGAITRRTMHVFIQGPSRGLLLTGGPVGEPIVEGDLVEAYGTLGFADGVTGLNVLGYRVAARERRPPVPEHIQVGEVGEPFEGRLVHVSATAVGWRDTEMGRALAVRGGDATLDVIMPAGFASSTRVETGDLLEIVGIVGQEDFDPPFDAGYRLHARSPEDITVLPGAGGVDDRVLFALAAALAALLLWLATLRRQVNRRSTELAHSEERYRQLVYTSPAPVLVHAGGAVEYANAAAVDLFGTDDLIGRPAGDFLPESLLGAASAPDDDPDVRTGVPGERERSIEATILREDGSGVDVDAVTTRTRYRGRDAVQVVLRDVTEHKAREQRLRHDALHDPLTNLPNRALFLDRLEQAIKHGRRHEGDEFAVLFLDLDRFKVVNDSLGHLQGDRLLQEVADRLRAVTRDEDTVARLGGDEFAILVNDVRDLGDATRVADRVSEVLAAPITLAGHELGISASTGIALSWTDYEDPLDVLRDADTAMYRAKDQGVGRYQVFDREMHAAAMKQLRLEADLRKAVDNGEFGVRYQPIVDIESGALVALEALVRWQVRDGGEIRPAGFIDLAEETGLIVPMGWQVLEQACAQLRAWKDDFHMSGPVLSMHVNLSGKQVAQPDLAERIESILADTGLHAEDLRIEITESVAMDETESTVAALTRLQAAGVPVCIDDFGTGYSSLSYLHRFPFDALKIDRSFVSGSEAASSVNWEIVNAIVTLAGQLGKGVIAEGVETPEQLGFLRAIGAPHAQGNMIAPPLQVQEMRSFIDRALREGPRAPWRLGDSLAGAPRG
ncbi:MAG TPA: EAL domain-containing protein [Longimicrobiales bacterium]|nr:EAL domain-containing protein [Longimicrobiales bacterium]